MRKNMQRILAVFTALGLMLMSGCGIPAQNPKVNAPKAEERISVSGLQRIETRYYILYTSDMGKAYLYKRHIDDFTDMMKQFVGDFKVNKKIPVYFLSDSEYQKRASGGMKETYGYYSAADQMIVMNIDLGLGTVNHEIVHYIEDLKGYRLNEFDSEGIAMAFEKTITDYSAKDIENNVPKITYGYYHPRRIQNSIKIISDMSRSGKKFKLESLFNSKNLPGSLTASNKDIIGTFFTYMLQSGKLQDYISNLNTEKDTRTRIGIAFGKSIQRVQGDYLNWLYNAQNDPDVLLVPITSVYTDQVSVYGRTPRFDYNVVRWTFK